MLSTGSFCENQSFKPGSFSMCRLTELQYTVFLLIPTNFAKDQQQMFFLFVQTGRLMYLSRSDFNLI